MRVWEVAQSGQQRQSDASMPLERALAAYWSGLLNDLCKSYEVRSCLSCPLHLEDSIIVAAEGQAGGSQAATRAISGVANIRGFRGVGF